MDDPVELPPVRFAELVAPAVSRAFVAGMRAGGGEGRKLVADYGGTAVGYLIDLRNPLAAGRRLSPAELAALYRYDHPDQVRATLRRSVEHGLLDEAPDGTITATRPGRAFLRDLYALHGRVLGQRWSRQWVERLNPLLARVLVAAAETGGAAWAAQAPPHEPPGTPPGVQLLNRLSTLRYHRADAHAAAWQAAGLTAAQIAAMPWDAEWSRQRREVEVDTNRRAAIPYQVLTAGERLCLLADLAALP